MCVYACVRACVYTYIIGYECSGPDFVVFAYEYFRDY